VLPLGGPDAGLYGELRFAGTRVIDLSLNGCPGRGGNTNRGYTPGRLGHYGRNGVQKLVADVMTAWRSAERVAADLAPDDPARAAALAAVDQLQATFNELTTALRVAEAQANVPRGELDEALRAAATDIASDAKALQALERTKASLRAGDERVQDLSLEAKELSVEIAAKTQAELNLAKEAAG